MKEMLHPLALGGGTGWVVMCLHQAAGIPNARPVV